MKTKGLVCLLVFLMSGILNAQECAVMSSFKITSNGTINWDLFPEFDLPFQVIYGANIQNDATDSPLSHGFSHISDVDYIARVSIKYRALLYYETAIAHANQPWEIQRSPWGNNLDLYGNKWKEDYITLADNTGFRGIIDADIFAFDIERIWRYDHEILQFKKDPSVPPEYADLSDDEFLYSYKTDLRALYNLSVESIINKGVNPRLKVSSYSDSPIVNTFSNIQGNSWQDWMTDKSNLNFINTNNEGDVGGEFYEKMDFMAPSAYYYYDYPHPFAGEYLSYLLFQIEANRAWTDKPIIPFVWLRYSQNDQLKDQYIKPWMAESTAIFPFFSGANGLWLWDDPLVFKQETDFSTYEYFIKGLYRLSQFKYFFEGDHELVLETSARDYNENKQAIWRGVVKDQEILIAAHNPFAKDENEEVTIGVAYKNWSSSVKLKGYEVKLCKYDMSILGLENDFSFTVFPNPALEKINIRFSWNENEKAQLILLNSKGQELLIKEKTAKKGNNEWDLDISQINVSQFYLKLVIDNQVWVKKISKFE